MKLVQKWNSTTIIQNEITITGSNMKIPEDFTIFQQIQKTKLHFFKNFSMTFTKTLCKILSITKVPPWYYFTVLQLFENIFLDMQFNYKKGNCRLKHFNQ